MFPGLSWRKPGGRSNGVLLSLGHLGPLSEKHKIARQRWGQHAIGRKFTRSWKPIICGHHIGLFHLHCTAILPLRDEDHQRQRRHPALRSYLGTKLYNLKHRPSNSKILVLLLVIRHRTEATHWVVNNPILWEPCNATCRTILRLTMCPHPSIQITLRPWCVESSGTQSLYRAGPQESEFLSQEKVKRKYSLFTFLMYV